MRALTMDYQLTVPAILRRTEALYASKPVVSRRADRTLHRYTYGECLTRAKRLAAALRRLGVGPGDRVATLCWNHHQHLEAYFGVCLSGAVLHTLNLRLHPDDLAYIARHAGDSVLIVDRSLWPLWEKFRERTWVRHAIVVDAAGDVPEGAHDYERLVADADERAFAFAEPDEDDAVAMCYTTGTTGRPKGVVYSHRAIVLHSLACAMADAFGVTERDSVLPVVPMFHANAWGLPFICALTGAGLVMPGPHLDPRSLLELLAAERVTVTAGVPTIWLGILYTLDELAGQGRADAYDLSRLRVMLVGGAAAPESMIRGFQERHGLAVLHAWGMTEMAPVGTVGTLPSEVLSQPPDAQFAYRARQGRPAAFVEIRARGGDGLVPWDGATMGELEVRGAWVAGAYYESDDDVSRFTDDGWFRTGDIVTIDQRGTITVQDRAKDLIKSGGEWISSVALESALAGHPAVAEAAVVSVPHPEWLERPLAVVVLKSGRTATADELIAHLAPHFPKWWLPDEVAFVDAIPKTSVGKYLKSALRERFRERAGVR